MTGLSSGGIILDRTGLLQHRRYNTRQRGKHTCICSVLSTLIVSKAMAQLIFCGFVELIYFLPSLTRAVPVQQVMELIVLNWVFVFTQMASPYKWPWVILRPLTDTTK